MSLADNQVKIPKCFLARFSFTCQYSLQFLQIYGLGVLSMFFHHFSPVQACAGCNALLVCFSCALPQPSLILNTRIMYLSLFPFESIYLIVST